MSEHNRKKARLAVLVSCLLLLATAIALFVFYLYTRYLPLYLLSLAVLMPSVIYLLQLPVHLLRAPRAAAAPPAEAVAETDEAAAPADAPAPRKGHALRRACALCARTAVRVARAALGLLYRRRLWLLAAPTPIALIVVHLMFWGMTGRATSVYNVGYVIPVVLLLLFVLFVVIDRWCKYTATEDAFLQALLRNVRSALGVTRLSVLLTLVAMVIRLLGFYELQRWLIVALEIIFVYESVFLLLSLAVRLLRRELTERPDLSIPMPQLLGTSHELGVLSYLEENTGITMRSLWSIRFIKTLLPYTVVFAAAILWFSTGIIQIEAQQHGAVYRLGRLLERPLEPGLHLTLPWPIDRVDVYDTETVQKLTIGYRATESGDNIWTDGHGNTEYKLLLGGGDELVSINLRLEYRIDDLTAYLRSSASPEKLLEARAYELVTDRTINTDLETLMDIDRAAFAESFRASLVTLLDEYHTGLEIVSVVLESIHPPVEVASVYQGVVSAEIDAQRSILNAQATAAVTVAQAQASYDTSIAVATAEQSTLVAQARADVSEFMASVSADEAHTDAYRYYKYLNAVRQAYGQARLVIVGEGVDSSNLYFGNMVLN